MLLAFKIVACVSIANGLLWLPPFWAIRRYYAALLVIITAIVTGLSFGANNHAVSLLVFYFGTFLIFNNIRVVKHRMQAKHLYRATLRSWVFLTIYQITSFGMLWLTVRFHWSVKIWLIGVALFVAASNILLYMSTLKHSTAIQKTSEATHYSDHNLPTVSVLIPARNETDDLQACLQSLVEVNYPKLEILVLDDCSQLRRTPEIIRQFAHDGVRFIAGTVTPDGWLAKNHAYQQLFEEASGDYLLFCGVDVRFSTNSLRELVAEALSRQKSMISVMPMNTVPAPLGIENLIVQPLRYAWEIVLPRRRLASPSVLSTCWITDRKLLATTGGFKAFSRSIYPEVYLARTAVTHDDGYSFIASNVSMGLVCNKSVLEQRATAIRTRYPQLHRRPEAVSLQALAEISLFISPFLLLSVGLILSWWLLVGLALVSIAFNSLMFGAVVKLTYRKNITRSYMLSPLAALYDIGLLFYSMWKYETDDVIWKDRNVCIPLMYVVPSLPKL